MYVSVATFELYIEKRNGDVVWCPQIESGEEGTVLVWLIFWIAFNRKGQVEEDPSKEKEYGEVEQSKF